MITPAYLKEGDTIAIVAPGKKTNSKAIEISIKIFKSWGLNVLLGKNIYSNDHSYLAGTDQQRADDFQLALDSKEVKAIICARGGYGSSRIIDSLNFKQFIQNPKWIVGFSDITAFHLKASTLGIESIHATMPVLFTEIDSVLSIESLRTLLFGYENELHAYGNVENRTGRAQGKTIGGNLSLIVESLGTQNEPDLTGKILIIEEIEEYTYKVDRMMNQLKRAGKLKSLAGIAVGHFTSMQETGVPFGETVEQIILNAVKDYSFPVGFGFLTGHENPNMAWRQGAEAALAVRKDGAYLSFMASKLKNA